MDLANFFESVDFPTPGIPPILINMSIDFDNLMDQ